MINILENYCVKKLFENPLLYLYVQKENNIFLTINIITLHYYKILYRTWFKGYAVKEKNFNLKIFLFRTSLYPVRVIH